MGNGRALQRGVLCTVAAVGVASAESPPLAVEAVAGPPPRFRVWNPTPFPVPTARARITFLRGGRALAERRRTLPGLAPFRHTDLALPDWRGFAPGRVSVCIDVDGRSAAVCAQQALPGTRADLRVGALRVENDRAVAELRNEGDVACGAFEVRITTRASGRIVGTATRTAAALGPRTAREESFPLERWGAPPRGGDAGEALFEGCCATEITLDPNGRIDEADEGNNALRVEHGTR